MGKKIIILSVLILVIFLASINFRITWNEENPVKKEALDLTSEQFLKLPVKDQYKYIEEYIDKKSPLAGWQFFLKTYQKNSKEIDSAHDLAHLIGGLAYKKLAFSGLSVCDPSFAFGCFHGFLDSAFANGLENLDKAEQACLAIGKVNSGPYGSCIHGIGHGLASFYQVKNLEKSLDECKKLSNGSQFCYDGVFMEYQRSAAKDFYTKVDPLYPCNTLPVEYQTACGRNQPMVMLQRLNLSMSDVIHYCDTSSSQEFKDACFDALGFYSVSISGQDLTKIIAFCQQSELVNFQNRCLKAAAGEMVFQNIPNWRENSVKVCEVISDQSIRNECVSYTHFLAQDYGRR